MTDSEGEPSKTLTRRRRLTILLVVLACLGVTVSGVAVWLHRTLLVTDEWVETVAPVIEDPTVQRNVAEFVGEEVVTVLDLEARITEALPPRLELFSAPIVGRVEDVVTRETQEFMESPAAEQLWTEANRVAHGQIVRLLRDEPGLVYTEGEEIRLNVLPIIGRVVTVLRERFPQLFPGAVPLPIVTAETPPADAVAQFETAFARDLPPEFGQVKLLETENLEQAQATVKLFDRVVWVLVLVTTGLIAAAILLSPRRLRTALQLGAGTAIALVLVVLVVRWLEEQLVAAVAGPGSAAARTTIAAAVDDFAGFARLLLIAAVVVAVAAYLASRADLVASTATRGRDSLARYRAHAGLLARHLDGFRLAGVAVGVTIIVITLPSWWAGLLIVAAVAIYELALAWLTYTWPWGRSGDEAGAQPEAANEG